MRVLLQRVQSASVSVQGNTIGKIDKGLLAFVGIQETDTPETCQKLVNKALTLRIFEDEQGKMNLSLLETGGGLLVVSQFTLYADMKKGRRPSFTQAAKPDIASPLVDVFAEQAREQGVSLVETGQFGANMQVSLMNDGPVTLWLDSELL